AVDERRLLSRFQLDDLGLRLPRDLDPGDVLGAAVAAWLQWPAKDRIIKWSNLGDAIRGELAARRSGTHTKAAGHGAPHPATPPGWRQHLGREHAGVELLQQRARHPLAGKLGALQPFDECLRMVPGVDWLEFVYREIDKETIAPGDPEPIVHPIVQAIVYSI